MITACLVLASVVLVAFALLILVTVGHDALHWQRNHEKADTLLRAVVSVAALFVTWQAWR